MIHNFLLAIRLLPLGCLWKHDYKLTRVFGVGGFEMRDVCQRCEHWK